MNRAGEEKSDRGFESLNSQPLSLFDVCLIDNFFVICYILDGYK